MNSFSLEKKVSHLEPGQHTWSHVRSSTCCHQNSGFELLYHLSYSPFVFVLHGKWLAGRSRTTLLQWNQSFG